MHGNGSIERPDEFVTNLVESDSDVPSQFCPYDIRVIVVLRSHSQCVFELELKESM
jgi:hypothetical protein